MSGRLQESTCEAPGAGGQGWDGGHGCRYGYGYNNGYNNGNGNSTHTRGSLASHIIDTHFNSLKKHVMELFGKAPVCF